MALLVAAGLSLAAAAGCGTPSAVTDAAVRVARLEALRQTAAAEVFANCKDSVVNLGVVRRDAADSKTTHTEFGSGVVVHESGYLLTNAHALRYGGRPSAGFHGGAEYTARVVAVDETRDLAVLKITAPPGPNPVRFKPVTFGHSSRLMVGERIITLGNPFGMGLTVTEGITSALGRPTKSEYTYYPDMIQTEASVNPGSSGGPVFNVFGEMVGLNATAKTGANDIGFAIPVDRIREALPEILAPEGRLGFVLGMQVSPDVPAEVRQVAAGSPAEAAGVRPGDIVVGVGGSSVAGGLDFYFALMESSGGQTLPLRLSRQRRVVETSVTLAKVEPRPADQVAGLAPGLVCEYSEGRWDRLPDLAHVRTTSAARAATFDVWAYKGKSYFALRFMGYIDVPADGVYAFYTTSHDGSRLYIGDRLVVDNDGLHPSAERRGFMPLKAGKQPITVVLFVRGQIEDFKVSWEPPGANKKQPIPASALFSPAPQNTPGKPGG